MKLFTPVVYVLGLIAANAIAAAALAQDYPGKTVRIVATEPGGGGDIVGRIIAQGLGATWSQQVIVDNRNGIIANEMVAKSPPDGYTLLINSSNLWLWPYLRSDVPWDPLKDFTPITLAIRQPNIIVVHPSLGVKNVRELIAAAKAKPGALNYGSSGPGASTHLAAELFNSLAGVHIIRVNFKGTSAALNSLIGGQLQVMFPNAASALPHVKSGKLVALAVTTAQPTALAPGLPTVTDSGLPGYEADIILGVFAPAGTPANIVSKLNQDMGRVLTSPGVKEKLFNIGIDAVAGSPDQLLAAVKLEMQKWGKVIKDADIRLE